MLKDDRARRLAIEFGGNWLDFRRFDESNTVDRGRFPAFTNELRDAMFEEPIRFIDDVIRNDRPVLDLLYGDYTFVNPVLARHYGMPESDGRPDQWVRVNQAPRLPARRAAADGRLPDAERTGPAHEPGQARILGGAPRARRSDPCRRRPLFRSCRRDEAKLDLPLRDMLVQHRSNPACASCHARFDSFGLTLENYGPIGEARTKDLAGHAVDTQASFPGAVEGNGLSGLQAYIRANREKDFLDNFSRKLLVYALGRSLLLSDEPLIAADERPAGREWISCQCSDRSDRDQSAVPEPARPTGPDEQKGGELDGSRRSSDGASRRGCHDVPAVARFPVRASRRHPRARSSRSGSPCSSWATASTRTTGAPKDRARR